jgi:polysaccharide export outer membrane protein
MKTSFVLKYNHFLVLLLILLQSCVSKKEVLYLQDIDTYNNTDITYRNSTIQVDDILKITIGAFNPAAALPYNNISSSLGGVANNIDLLKLDGYLVSQGMIITIPVLGEISVEGKTTHALENHLKERLQGEGYLIDATVIVRLLNAKFTILGEVRNPGTFTFTENNISLLQALGLAGDLTINGSREDVLLLRRENGVQTTSHLDLTSGNWLNGPYQMIKPNDVIVVSPNGAKVKTAGYVGNVSVILSIASIILTSILLFTR